MPGYRQRCRQSTAHSGLAKRIGPGNCASSRAKKTAAGRLALQSVRCPLKTGSEACGLLQFRLLIEWIGRLELLLNVLIRKRAPQIAGDGKTRRCGPSLHSTG